MFISFWIIHTGFVCIDSNIHTAHSTSRNRYTSVNGIDDLCAHCRNVRCVSASTRAKWIACSCLCAKNERHKKVGLGNRKKHQQLGRSSSNRTYLNWRHCLKWAVVQSLSSSLPLSTPASVVCHSIFIIIVIAYNMSISLVFSYIYWVECGARWAPSIPHLCRPRTHRTPAIKAVHGQIAFCSQFILR